jgi:hypothetical protein
MKLANIVTTIKEVPHTWIYKTYLKQFGRVINEPMDGRNIKIKSIFNPGDRVPSMYLLYSPKKKQYVFYDHSTSTKGDIIDIVKICLNTTSYAVVEQDVVSRYQKFLNDGFVYDEQEIEFDLELKPIYSAIDIIGEHNNLTKAFLKEWSINESVLEYLNVFPLNSYTLLKKENKVYTEVLTHENELLFGVYDDRGTLMKIYQPHNSYAKFISFKKDFYLGYEQLNWEAPVCVIMSGLKDLACCLSMDSLNIAVVAPPSENTLIDEKTIKLLLAHFPHVFTHFDNDVCGKQAMLEYKNTYNIDYITFKSYHENDFAKNVKKYSQVKIFEEFVAEINKKTTSNVTQ